ncbi:ATP synthase F0 subunit 8 (mitochondrion) [Oryzias melastigma]|uniref:ATP synthase complex subunit 8 n=2 Tax=Oryzias TaxID=8089 RepID=J3RRR8_ORYME|nr:ATP synthase F0 subunit 8 [Oryzias dancena]YP_006665913.1 ATP synthase F0 subunit 8 [Oryzias melastigma]AFE62791.1 ATP synthase F0 subunit 8 [Oryzias melastigma]BAH84949.1 ATPase subunit 8 [Oryzias dancena]
MPQLNPAPWFAILIFSWLVFLIFIPQKVLAYKFLNEPAPQNVKKSSSTNWLWPWL